MTWCFMGLFLFPGSGFAQDDDLNEMVRIEILESRVKHFYGVEKYDALIDLSDHYTKINGRKATRYAKQAVTLAGEIFVDEQGNPKPDLANRHPNGYIQLGKAYYFDHKFLDAQEAFVQANKISQTNNFLTGISESEVYLAKIDSLVEGGQEIKRNFFSQSLKSIGLKEKVNKVTLDYSISTKINSAESHVNKYEYDQAIQDYEDAINLLKNKGDEEQINLLKDKIVEINKLMNVDEEVVKYYNDAIMEQERIIEELTQKSIEDTLLQYDDPRDSTLDQSDLGIDRLVLRSNSFNDLAEEYLEKEDYNQAEKYRLLTQQVEGEIKKREDAETQLILLRQQKQIAEFDLQTKNMQLQGQRKTKQNFIVGVAMLLALAFTLLALYLSKKRDHKKLGKAYRVLEETQSKLSIAEGNIRKLLRQQVSEDIAKELMTGGSSLSTKKSFVCVMFLDIRDFTSWAEKRDPEEIIKFQNRVFGFMIDIVNEYNGNINQLLGDGFMATFGAPKSSGNDCQNAFDAAMKIIGHLNKNIGSQEIGNTKIGIGLHAGYVVTGNVGTETRKQYSITGNTVILASRIEQLNKKFGSQLVISREVYEKLEHFDGEAEFREVVVKGRRTPIEVLTIA